MVSLKIKLKIFIISFAFFSSEKSLAWGFYAHKKINYYAVFLLPSPLIGFYKNNQDYLSEHAVDPDKRRYTNKEEACRHFIDLDHYLELDNSSIPKKWDDAQKKYSIDSLNIHGIVPWQIAKMTFLLQEAFKQENLARILKLSAELGHYIADAHVPLHTTRNYNGQLSNQKGIHGLWESRLPELFENNYDKLIGKAVYIDNPLDFAWDIVNVSFAAKDSVLNLEAELNNEFDADKKYTFEQKNKLTTKVYSAEYAKAYHQKLNGMVEKRYRASIYAVSCLWYTAWINAGQPDLNRIKEQKKGSFSTMINLENEIKQDSVPLFLRKGHED